MPKSSSEMPEPFSMEALSLAYVYAIAAKAGINVYTPQRDLGFDMLFSKVTKRENGRRTDTSSTPLPCQIKVSTLWQMREDMIIYDLEVKNYNDLVNSDICLLILMCLPPCSDEWLHQNEDRLQLHKCCYYWCPSDPTETTNSETKRIFIPRSQMFTVDALTRLIAKAQSQRGNL